VDARRLAGAAQVVDGLAGAGVEGRRGQTRRTLTLSIVTWAPAADGTTRLAPQLGQVN